MIGSGRVVRTTYRVIYGDTDQMGVVYYANYLRMFERGRCEVMRAAGISYQAVEDAGFMLPVLDVSCRYRAPGRFDDLLTIETTVARVTRLKVIFDYRVLRDDGEGEITLAEGSTTHGSLDKSLRPARIPDGIAARLRG